MKHVLLGMVQHYGNPLHVYCRLVRIVGKQRARAMAHSWERIFTVLFYAKPVVVC